MKPKLGIRLTGVGLAGVALAGVAAWGLPKFGRLAESKPASTGAVCAVGRIPDLMTLSVDRLAAMDVARLNLLCAAGLPGAEEFDLNQCLAALDAMADRVRVETDRHFYRFQKNPAEFEESEGYFRMLMLAVVLAEDFGVRYAPDKIGTAAEARSGDGFFGDSRDVFLHGLTDGRRQGTCSSLPVLHVAVGRRLGYPLKLVTTKGHLFVRWDEARERFNVEVSGSGVNRFSDEYYRHWPLEVPEEEIEAEGYLRSLTPAEELAVFLSIRGMCWLEAGQEAEAAESFRAAARLAPDCASYRVMAGRCKPYALNHERGKL